MQNLTADQTAALQALARQIRVDSVTMVHGAKSGHPGGPLGLADIFAYLFKHFLRYNATNPESEDRDRFILSNGHTCAVYYSAMARSGFFEASELSTFRRLGSRLQGHPSPIYLPWLENSGGSLGQGLSFAVGSALAGRVRKADWRVVAGLSDGECQEGMTWEAAMAAAHYKLDNLIAFVDRNDIQIDGRTRDVMDVEPFMDKWMAFGWAVMEADGHNMAEIHTAFEWAKSIKGRPAMIIFNTVLGKGVSYMENQAAWHGKPPSDDQLKQALQELSAA